ncbi:disrupted in schizophrenia 1 protein [Pristis pectinata]|uniref:disrupted in schizophrenia 1 protein n=1 Tax=Pristis pectinata TaxID=685728 RepID=UPI00223E7516|nr:disrupted in schizophrenia 1 protein [Pristis pectinata]
MERPTIGWNGLQRAAQEFKSNGAQRARERGPAAVRAGEPALGPGRAARMFAGMNVMTVSDSPTFPSRLGSVPDGGDGPGGQRPQERDSVVPRVKSCKKKLSKRPGYMWKDVEQRLSHPTPAGIHLASQHLGKEMKTCIDLSFDINKQEKYRLNNKHLSENKIAEYQNTVSDHLPARSSVVAAMIVSESVRHSLDSSCQWIDSQEDSSYTGINTYSKHLLTGDLQKKGACLKQCKKERGIDVSKPQAVASPIRQVDSENLQRQQPWDIDKEMDSANTFISSFNFIQMSSNCNSTSVDSKDELQQNRFVLQFPNAEPEMRQHDANTLVKNQFCSKSLWKDFETHSLHASQKVGIRCGTDTKSENRPQDYDLLSLDMDVCLCSADSSDGSCGSSVTSGYESSITVLDQKCNSLMRKYDPILQDCLHENRMKLKLQTLILKLQKLQKKAVQNDDYEKADKFNKKLAELKREQSSLKFQLPSYHPCILRFLQKFELQQQVAEHQNDCILNKRSQLIQDRQQLQKEIAEIKERLALLEARDHQLCIEIEEGNRLIESCDCELTSLPNTSASELHDLHKMLEDVLPLRNKVLLNEELPEHIKRLQRREQLLSIAIKTAAAKVCSSQKLCSNFSKKVSDIETQLPTLLEAKMLAISGYEFSTAKDCAEEIKCLTSDKGRLEGIINDLQSLIIRNGQQLEAIKDDYSRLKTELEQEERLFENDQRENVIKYMGVLEDKLHSCGTHLFEKVWEADLETCQLFIRGLHLKESSYHACEGEEYRTGEEDEAIEDSCSDIKDAGDYFFPNKQDWRTVQCFVPDQKETDSSEVSMKCFPSTKGSQSKVAYKGSAVEIGEQCEDISDKLVCLEEQLQVAVNNHDDSLTQYLQREIQMVKEALQAMLKQLLSLEEGTTEDFVVNIW